MSIRSIAAAASLRRLLRGFLAWALAALLLLLIASFVLARAGTGSQVLGYISSAVSFFSALAAGVYGTDGKSGRLLLQGLLLAIALILVLLTIGFLAREGQLDPSGVLSVVSFTGAGALLGSLLSGQKRGGKSRAGKGKLRVTRRG